MKRHPGLVARTFRPVLLSSAGFLLLLSGLLVGLISARPAPESVAAPLPNSPAAPAAPFSLFLPVTASQVLNPFGAQVHGFVAAVFGDAKQEPEILLPDVRVHLIYFPAVAPVTVPGSLAQTNFHGYFMTNNIPPGTYQVCVDAPGFLSTCDPTPITLTNHTFVLDHDIQIHALPGVIKGQVLLKDGQPCYAEDQFFRTQSWATVWLQDTLGSILAGPINANSQGYYVLPKIPGPGPVELGSTCDTAKQLQPITLTSNDLLGLTPINLTVPHSTPKIQTYLATSGGQEVRRAAPGAVVHVDVGALDPNGDPLHYRWGDLNQGLFGPDASAVNWPLSSAPGLNVLYVQVRNKLGGFITDKLVVDTQASGALFQGVVTNFAGGAPIPGAEVSINGKILFTGPNGAFNITVPDAARYVINVHKPGFALRSQVFTQADTGLNLVLFPATRTPCDPTAQCSATSEGNKTFINVTISPNTLVDANGNPAAGALFIDAHDYDLNQPNAIPGDYGALTLGGSAVTLNSYAAASIEISDAAGNRYTLGAGKTAVLTMTVDPAIVTAGPPPANIPLWEYDEKTGLWMQRTSAVYDPGTHRYTGPVTGFSAWNADSQFSGTACIAVDVRDVDPTHLAPPFPFRLTGDIPASPGLFRHPDFTVDSAPFAIYRLPPGAIVSITLHTNTGPDFPTPPVFTVNAGAAIDPLYEAAPFNGIPPLYALHTACHGSLTITLPLPSHDVPYLSVPSQPCDITSPTACDAEATSYFKAVGALDNSGDPTSTRGTFNAWKTTNHFSLDPANPAAGEIEAIYYNNGDLQFGRDMHCIQNGSAVACYVTNYSITGGPGGPDQPAIAQAEAHASPIATVAMEYNPAASANQVSFYAYKADLPNHDGTLFKNPALDSEGPKFMPWICLACHGGAYTPLSGSVPAHVDNASFLPFDSPTFKQDQNLASIFSAPNQVDAFRALNSLVRATNPNTSDPNDPIRSLIDGWYAWCGGLGAGGCDISDTLANRYIPTGWAGHADLYQEIPRVYCRTCHVAQSTYPDWTQFSVFNSPGFVGGAVCTQRSMPHAEVPFKRFWLSTSPHDPAYLASAVTGINIPGGCPP